MVASSFCRDLAIVPVMSGSCDWLCSCRTTGCTGVSCHSSFRTGRFHCCLTGIPCMPCGCNIFGLCIVTVRFSTMISLDTGILTRRFGCDLSLIQCMSMALSTAISLTSSRSITVIFPIVSEGRTGFIIYPSSASTVRTGRNNHSGFCTGRVFLLTLFI